MASADGHLALRAMAQPRAFPWSIFFGMWLAFWVLLFTLGVQEYRWSGGNDFWQPAIEYGSAALVSTVFGVVQLYRARRFDHLLGHPLRWLARLWVWMPLETLAFIAVMFVVPRAVSASVGMQYDTTNWLETEVYDTAKFLLFYFLAGGIQFGIHSYNARATDRARATEQSRLAQEAQLAQLTQQLQPHFLFNGLNTVSALIHEDPQLADTLLSRFATLLRAATSAMQRSEQSLGDELVLLRAYADIMTHRFASRVRVEWAIDEDTVHCQVPTLGLQPLLENCFHHVVEKRRAPTLITVRSWLCPAGLCVEVANDGDPFVEAPASGVGLGNLRQRLDLLHPGRARLALLPRPGGGLTARVELPSAR